VGVGEGSVVLVGAGSLVLVGAGSLVLVGAGSLVLIGDGLGLGSAVSDFSPESAEGLALG